MVEILTDVKEIGNYSFYKTSITSLDLVEGLEKIGDYAFLAVEELNELYLAGSVKEVGIDAFEANTNRVLYYYGTIENWCEINFASRKSNPINDDYIYQLNNDNEWEEVKEIIIPTNITRRCGYCGRKF